MTSCRWVLGALWLCGEIAPAQALVITPARTEIHLAPGMSTKLMLTAMNDDKVEIQVDVSKKDWFVMPANKALTVDTWLKVHGPERFYLKPGKSRNVTLTVFCPKTTEGELVGMTSFRYQTEHPSMVTPMISVSIYVMAAGQEKMEGSIKDIVVRKYNERIVVTTVMAATGNVHLRPSGRVVVADSKGTELASMMIPEGQPTYPGTQNLYASEFPADLKLAPGVYVAKADLGYQELKFQDSRSFTVLSNGDLQMVPGTPITGSSAPKI